MVQARCVEKFRNKNNAIICYRLVDKNGSILDVKPENLKLFIKQGEINVSNLKLTSDYKLISCDQNKNESLEAKFQRMQKTLQSKSTSTEAIAKEYAKQFDCYITKALILAGIDYTNVNIGDALFNDSESVYLDERNIRIQTYINLNKQYNGRDICISVFLWKNTAMLNIYYSDTLKEINQTSRFMDRIDWKFVSPGNRRIIAKLVDCIRAL
jgi:hypothetical protein